VKLQDQAANFLTNNAYDEASRIPEYKVCAVRIEKKRERKGAFSLRA
jgi:predicted molibdopterin-dependent oxidoreductase YjgC